jgi:peptidoglycan/LPS O-acetylase OafA/YrhL
VRAPLRLPYLDGLRAAAALYVVLFHAAVGFIPAGLPFWARNVRRLLMFGHDAVAIFIVLSGYCLMLPAVRADGHLIGGMRRYFGRRAWRILPPYYATVALSLLLLWAVPILQAPTGTIWDDTSPAFASGPIATHLLLVHNLFPAWASRINGPLWSVATEWQIYFFFPLLLLPVWRRAGSIATVLVGFAVGCAPIWLTPNAATRWVPWYLGLFALGMCAAAASFSSRATDRNWLERVPWKFVVWTLSGCCLLGMTLLVKTWFRLIPVSDALVGATTAALLIRYTDCVVRKGEGAKPRLLRIFESRLLVGLGHFSYSLYLSHLPVVALCYFALRPFALSGQARLFSMVALSVPASLATAFAFFWAIERHFVGRPPTFAKRRS